jgi:RNA polymerase-binding protein DksA
VGRFLLTYTARTGAFEMRGNVAKQAIKKKSESPTRNPAAKKAVVAARKPQSTPRRAGKAQERPTLVSKAAHKSPAGKSPRVVAARVAPEPAPEAATQMPRAIPTAVPTTGKPRKNQAGLNARELEHYRDLLLQKRREIVGDMGQMEREALRSAAGSNLYNLPLHMADMGTDNYEQEFTLGLVEKDRNLLREINTALAKIMDGSYGICEGTGKPISKVRLEAQPWARFSIEYARQMEKGFLR